MLQSINQFTVNKIKCFLTSFNNLLNFLLITFHSFINFNLNWFSHQLIFTQIVLNARICCNYQNHRVISKSACVKSEISLWKLQVHQCFSIYIYIYIEAILEKTIGITLCETCVLFSHVHMLLQTIVQTFIKFASS